MLQENQCVFILHLKDDYHMVRVHAHEDLRVPFLSKRKAMAS